MTKRYYPKSSRKKARRNHLHNPLTVPKHGCPCHHTQSRRSIALPFIWRGEEAAEVAAEGGGNSVLGGESTGNIAGREGEGADRFTTIVEEGTSLFSFVGPDGDCASAKTQQKGLHGH